MTSFLCKIIVTAVVVSNLGYPAQSANTSKPATGAIPEAPSLAPAITTSTQIAFTEDTFNEVIDQIERLYADQPTKTIEVQRFWSPSGQVDSAIRFPYLTLENPIIKLTGAVPKSRFISREAYALLVCHEFGHHLAGGPSVGNARLVQWSSAEGQADYWAASNCLKTYFAQEERELIHPEAVPNELAQKCDKNFTTEPAATICKKGILAALSLADYFVGTKNSKIDFRAKAPAATQLVRTFRQDAFRDQCRVETFLAGTFCPADSWPKGCLEGDGARPACWYVEPTPVAAPSPAFI
jgi:hypothetical protein